MESRTPNPVKPSSRRIKSARNQGMSGPEALIPMTLIVTVGAIFISRSEIGRALAHRIRNGSGAAPDAASRLADLRQEVTELRQELTDTQERIDFAERLLAQGRASERLPRG
jgi:hypothetical protein